MYDASGYYSGNMYGGDNYRLGDPELCRELNDEIINRNYRQLADHLNPTIYEDVQSYLYPSQFLPFKVQMVNAKYKAIVNSSPIYTFIIHQSVCMPKSCTYYDLTQVMSYANISHLRNNFVMRNSELIDVRILNQSYDFSMDEAFLMFMLVFCLNFFFI